MLSIRRSIFSCILMMLVAACGGPERETEDESDDILLPAYDNSAWGYVDTTGQVVIEPQFERAWRFSDGLALVKTERGFGFINRDGSFAIEPRFSDAWHFAGGIAPVELDSSWAYVDKTGEVVADTQFQLRPPAIEEIAYDTPQLQLATSNGQYGYQGADGDFVIDPRFENAWRFSDGLARVKSNGKWGFIDRNGAFAIEPRFDVAWDFDHGIAMVEEGGQLGYIDREGRFVYRPGS